MRLWRSWRFRRPRPGRKLHPTPRQAIAMDSEFHAAALSDSDHGACGALPSESELELLMRMPGWEARLERLTSQVRQLRYSSFPQEQGPHRPALWAAR